MMQIKQDEAQPSSRRSATSPVHLMEAGDDRDQIGRRLMEAYIQLAVTAPSRAGIRSVMLKQFGRVEVHFTELPLEQPYSSIPPLWLEVVSDDDGTTIDGYGCFDLGEDELTAAVDLILDAKRA
jgi:hypothetical protein